MVTPETQAWYEIVDLIPNVARQYANIYTEVEYDDIVQTLHVKALEVDRHKVVSYEKPQLIRMLSNWCVDYCEEELDALFPDQDDRYTYSKGQITALLPFVLTAEHFSTLSAVGEKGEGKSNRDPALSGDALATYADLTRGWDALSRDEKALLAARYIDPDPTPYEVLADDLEVSEDAVRKRVERAIRKMQRAMGGGKPKGDTKRVQSNAAAQATVSRQWEGG